MKYNRNDSVYDYYNDKGSFYRKILVIIFIALFAITFTVNTFQLSEKEKKTQHTIIDIEQMQNDYWYFPIRHITSPYNEDYTIAQSFKPSYSGRLAKVKILMNRNTDNDFILSIRDGLNNEDLTKITKSQFQFSFEDTWIEFDFPDIQVTKNKTYYIVGETTMYGDYSWILGKNTPYSQGAIWASDDLGESWEKNEKYDLCFQTYMSLEY